MLLGEYTHTIDSKGRLAIPAKFRAALTAGAIATRGLDNCLFLFTAHDWRELAQKLVSLPISSANSRAFARLMLSGAMAVEFDSQGRILIPEYLRSYASLTKRTVITGLYNRVEIWDEARWKSYKQKTESASETIAEQLGELGI